MSKGQLVTVFGGSGFVGRHVVRALTRDGWRVRVASRRPDLAFYLQPLGRTGQTQAVQANLRDPVSVSAALRGASAAINLAGILAPTGAQTFDAVQHLGAQIVAQAVKAAGIEKFVHVSAIGADINSASAYARSKGEGEASVHEALPSAVILRPSLVFGPEDDFFNRFAALARMSPVMPLIGGGKTLFQPVYVGDLAQAVALAVAGNAKAGTIYELGGPQQRDFSSLLHYICDVTGRHRLFVPLPFGAARLFAGVTEIASKLSLGLYPKMLTMTRDQVLLLQSDNIVSKAAESEGRTLAGLGITAETIEAIVPSYLARFRKSGEFSAAQP
ncbi:MAG: complex I NDUFA9 subunit family protein [Hyphomicrobiales bacterium]|nr:complex I NDUFA9 subunit family protein [Hyphomicrobiales bacterium]MDE2114358.1 complex I NDUFA9 subunit family protein [Hyphomicrobiales bacterium]